MRDKIDIMETGMDLLVKMSEGNLGGLSVLVEIMQEGTKGFLHILNLDDMNIRGSQIWIGYKYWADQDLEKFIEGIRNRNPEMVALINKEHALDSGTEVAVTSGASFRR